MGVAPINIHSTLSFICKKSASQAVLSRMQLTRHETRQTTHGASRLGLAMYAWSVKTRRAPSRHCKGARIYGHTTTAMHDNEHTHPYYRTVGLQRYKYHHSACCARAVHLLPLDTLRTHPLHYQHRGVLNVMVYHSRCICIRDFKSTCFLFIPLNIHIIKYNRVVSTIIKLSEFAIV